MNIRVKSVTDTHLITEDGEVIVFERPLPDITVEGLVEWISNADLNAVVKDGTLYLDSHEDWSGNIFVSRIIPILRTLGYGNYRSTENDLSIDAVLFHKIVDYLRHITSDTVDIVKTLMEIAHAEGYREGYDTAREQMVDKMPLLGTGKMLASRRNRASKQTRSENLVTLEMAK